MTSFTECPICGAALQVTQESENWYTDSTFRFEVVGGSAYVVIEDLGADDGHEDKGEPRLYCANDHTDDQMAAALEAA